MRCKSLKSGFFVWALLLAGCTDQAPAKEPSEAASTTSMTQSGPSTDEPVFEAEVANETFHLDSASASRSIDVVVPAGANKLNGTVSILDGFTRGFRVTGLPGCDVNNDNGNIPAGVPRVFWLDCSVAPGQHELQVALTVGYAQIEVRLVALEASSTA